MTEAVAGGVRRPPLLGQALASGALGAALLGLAITHDWALLAGLVVVQLLATVGFLALVEAPASGGTFLLVTAAAAAADVVVLAGGKDVGGLAGVVALSLVASLLHQLLRRQRSRVTESLADTFVGVVLVCSTVSLLGALRQEDGTWPTRAALAAAATALVAGRIGDAVVRKPALALGATRAWPGLLLALGTGVATSVLVAGDHLIRSEAALVGLTAATTVVAIDLVLDLAASELTADPTDARRVASLRPVATVLPYAALGPVVLLCVQLINRS